MCNFTAGRIRASDVQEYLDILQIPNPDYEELDIPPHTVLEQFFFFFEDGQEVALNLCSGAPNEPLWCEGELVGYGVQETEKCALAGYWEFEDKDKNYYLLSVSMI